MADDDAANSSLGEKLLAAVNNLWQAVNGHTADIGELQRRMKRIESELHGLKVSRGMARAKNIHLQNTLTKAENTLSDIRERLH
jgi:predicted  nucleic acid-binding Zn-ribbon protein